jgi:putative FmdB family regulatory protein
MPIYEYTCEQCGKLIDVLQKMGDPAPAKCESCGAEGKLTRVVSKTSFVLKGGGWYSDLYSSKKDSTSAASGEKKDAGGASGTSTASPAPAAGASASTTSAAPAAAPAASSGSSGSGSSGSSGGGGDKK